VLNSRVSAALHICALPQSSHG